MEFSPAMTYNGMLLISAQEGGVSFFHPNRNFSANTSYQSKKTVGILSKLAKNRSIFRVLCFANIDEFWLFSASFCWYPSYFLSTFICCSLTKTTRWPVWAKSCLFSYFRIILYFLLMKHRFAHQLVFPLIEIELMNA